MEPWITQMCRAVGMGLAWAAVWVPAGLLPARLIAGEIDPEHIGGPLYAGLVCGTFFSALAGIAAGRRRLGDMPILEAAAWGAVSGLATGVLPFVIGDNGAYQNGWSTAIVGTSAIAAAVLARRRRPAGMTSSRAAALAVALTGSAAGVLPWILTSPNGPDQFLPLAAVAALSGLSAFSAGLSPSVARWFNRQSVQASQS